MTESSVALASDETRLGGAGPQPDDGDTLKDLYDACYRVVQANTEEARERSFRLRYQVYCLENAFESAADNPGGMETDAYDDQAMHSLLLHRPGGQAVGTVRLILPQVRGHRAPLPIESICAAAVMDMFAHRIPSGRTAEISRFAVAKRFRRQRDGNRGAEPSSGPARGEELRAGIPHICLGLMRAIVAMARESGMSHLCAVMEPALLRMLRNLGVRFEPLGPMVDYHGRRQPCFCDLDRLLAATYRTRPDVWAVITDSGGLWPVDRWRRLTADGLVLLRGRLLAPADRRAGPLVGM